MVRGTNLPPPPPPTKRLKKKIATLRSYVSLSNFTILLIYGALSSGVDGFSLTDPCQKLKKPWKGLSRKGITNSMWSLIRKKQA